MTAASGSFQTEGWPNSYTRRNFQCEWFIQLPDTSAAIEFTIDESAFGINGRPPCTTDHIEFFDGTSTNAASLEKICGLPHFYESDTLPIITTTSSRARVVFTGSDRTRSATRVGVKVDYVLVPPVTTLSPNTTSTHPSDTTAAPTTARTAATTEVTVAAPTDDSLCGGVLTKRSGSFQTPGWPTGYPQDNFQCQWTINVNDPGYVIQFTIDQSHYGINGRSPCRSDNIEFFDGLFTSDPSLQKLCQFMNPGPFTTSSSQAFVLFTGTVNENRPASRVGVRVEYSLQDKGELNSVWSLNIG